MRSLQATRHPKTMIISGANSVISYVTDKNLVLRRKFRRTISLMIPRTIKDKISPVLPRKRQNLQTRRFLHPQLTLEEFFAELKVRNINYVVLRWFEHLPSVKEGEDIDLLIDDNDIEKIADLFVASRGEVAFDVYSVSGLDGSSYKGFAYYPPHLAANILKSRIWLNDLYAVPDAQHHFLSLAYHAVLHKGRMSGLPHHVESAYATPEHNYFEILQDLAEECGLERTFHTFSDFYDYLKVQGWVPELDTMRKLAKFQDDPWLLALLPDSAYDLSKGEMVVFVVRDWALKHGKLDIIVDLLKAHHLDVLLVHKLSNNERSVAKRELRGGKWAHEPGGLPGCLVVCYDHHPETLTQAEREELPFVKHPFLKNKRVFLIKQEIRNLINAEMLLFFHTNCIHSADDELEAWEYVRHAVPWYLDELKSQLDSRRNLHRTSSVPNHLGA